MTPSKASQQYISLIILCAALAGFSLAALIRFTNPATAGLATFGFLYASVFLFSFCLSLLLSVAARHFIFHHTLSDGLRHSFRQALLIAMFITASLALQSERLLSWWIELILILLLTSFEFFVTTRQ